MTYWTNPNRTGRLAMVRAEPTADDAQAGRPNSEFCYLTAEGALSQYEFGPMGILLQSMDTVGRGVDLAVRNLDDVWLVNADGAIWRRTRAAFTSKLLTGKPVPVVLGRVEYYWYPIAGPDFSLAQIYWVQPNDTFNQIAAAVGLTPQALHAKNPQIADINNIKVGEWLHL